MMMRSAPRPVSTPPTEVASRQPCALVSNSGIAARCGERGVGKIARYQPLATIERLVEAEIRIWSIAPVYEKQVDHILLC